MPTEIITTEDLSAFKLDLLSEFKRIIVETKPHPKKWLKSKEVRHVLGISTNTLNSLRIKGYVSFSRIGMIYYYSYEDLLQYLENHKIEAQQK